MCLFLSFGGTPFPRVKHSSGFFRKLKKLFPRGDSLLPPPPLSPPHCAFKFASPGGFTLPPPGGPPLLLPGWTGPPPRGSGSLFPHGRRQFWGPTDMGTPSGPGGGTRGAPPPPPPGPPFSPFSQTGFPPFFPIFFMDIRGFGPGGATPKAKMTQFQDWGCLSGPSPGSGVFTGKGGATEFGGFPWGESHSRPSGATGKRGGFYIPRRPPILSPPQFPKGETRSGDGGFDAVWAVWFPSGGHPGVLGPGGPRPIAPLPGPAPGGPGVTPQD